MPARRLAVALLAAGTVLTLTPAVSQTYPTQPVKIVVGFPPGGTTDVIGRLVAQELGESFGRPVVVENRPGASGTIGAGGVARALPDGHTLLVVPSTHGTAPFLYAALPYEDRDFAPVSLVASTPYVLVAHPSMPFKTFPELLAYVKQNPGKLEYASTSPGTAQHLAGELVKRMAGVDMVHVPYKGTGAVMPDLLAGRIPMMFENVAVMLPHIRKGSLRPIAVSSAKRTPLLPDVPAVAETLPGFEVLGWFGVYAPAKTPPDVVSRLNAEVNKAIAKPAVITRFAELGAEPLGGSPERMTAFVTAEQDKWGAVIRELGIKVQ